MPNIAQYAELMPVSTTLQVFSHINHVFLRQSARVPWVVLLWNRSWWAANSFGDTFESITSDVNLGSQIKVEFSIGNKDMPIYVKSCEAKKRRSHWWCGWLLYCWKRLWQNTRENLTRTKSCFVHRWKVLSWSVVWSVRFCRLWYHRYTASFLTYRL